MTVFKSMFHEENSLCSIRYSHSSLSAGDIPGTPPLAPACGSSIDGEAVLGSLLLGLLSDETTPIDALGVLTDIS